MARQVTESFESPESTLIARAQYDRDTHILLLTMKVSAHKRSTVTVEKTYRHDIPEAVWKDFAMAASKGAFFNKVIRPVYAGKLVE